MSGQDLPVLAVVGPTGSGKSDLGVALAARLGGEIINADSMQFYRGMDIGTAKLPLAERAGIPHHLLDIMDVTEEASVSAFQSQARSLITDIRSRGRWPILVGGSGLYVRAALDVLEFPGTDPEVRRRLEAELEASGLEHLRNRLKAVDPVSAGRLGDARRVVRALEVHELTGRPFSSFMPERTYFQPAVQIGLQVERSLLHSRLALRVQHMVEQGLEEEVRRLDAAGLRTGRTAGRALGYAQFLKVLDGESTVEKAAEDTVVATRQFARRQLTWFRADPRVTWLDFDDPRLVDKAAAAILEG
ncbi:MULTISPECIES: tRNA (adenosine(37)-N6)-dimethylallyltransferase MiaA [Arthrobacter]|uniref:tRNA dimethylallyltransferase n=1 Tax=Arthrobacter caoxuetaonis TaxID=2886935 RepID=A0A9X1MCY6_9MICC|nr:tRNA (adenosine(37)-N6)-dimethylallyltransferase MiaA [Arthrobacter caoxuetaonis]MCC3283971.1 tRNA (adenosine(37)-N6)-dimethylallyltransferase MiaA [Arthrobacter caoxuetaonis]MCC3297035.1 tRNA (adenosine(37)-N6)-dimethylallyltransferase MiaA [Arthrobacter caoxuetaonis]MCC9193922.1 tRNA (adenosine(37)-N6)-dimethylallyltransferase MiaA [Arthrobacter sp. zg-Y916]USQ58396.1 tRNA (adenosine(37)-N6)-dimethylallyltransferase MiaA [Arthrobacter caoxuetaonis]